MDSIMNSWRRMSTTPNHNRWSSHFSKLVDQAVQPRISVSRRVGILAKCEPWVTKSMFVNTSETEVLNAKHDLLRLWEFMLEFVTTVSDNRYKEMGYNVICAVMQRREFQLEQFGFGTQQQELRSGDKNNSNNSNIALAQNRPTPITSSKHRAAHLKLARRYKNLLVKTFLFVNKAMERKGRFVELIHFAAQTLAIFFFRLPVVGGRILDAMEVKVQSDAARSPRRHAPYGNRHMLALASDAADELLIDGEKVGIDVDVGGIVEVKAEEHESVAVNVIDESIDVDGDVAGEGTRELGSQQAVNDVATTAVTAAAIVAEDNSDNSVDVGDVMVGGDVGGDHNELISCGCVESDSRVGFVVAYYAPEMLALDSAATAVVTTSANDVLITTPLQQEPDPFNEVNVDSMHIADIVRQEHGPDTQIVISNGETQPISSEAQKTSTWASSPSLLEDIAALAPPHVQQSASQLNRRIHNSGSVDSYSGTVSERSDDGGDDGDDGDAEGGASENRIGETRTTKSMIVSKDALREAKLMEERTTFIRNNPDLFEWTYFYSNDEDEQRSLHAVVQSENNSCMNWLSTKETFFLTFVEMFAAHVNSVAVKPVCWSALPAYNIMLECFWKLLRSAVWWDGICKRVHGEGDGWVASYPAYMRVKRTAVTLLLNKNLINDFMIITFECTNLHSLLSVDSCIEHLNLWFSTVAYATEDAKQAAVRRKARKEPPGGPGSESQMALLRLPEEFDLDLFWSGLNRLLHSELFQSLLKTCSFLYNNFHLFRGSQRTSLINNLLSESFFFLFLHWSSEVRTYFQHLLIYKVLRADRRFLPCFTDTTVMERYGGADAERARSSMPDDLRKAKDRRTRERRLAVFDTTSKTTNNEELLIDVAMCSKIDSYVHLCLMEPKEGDGGGCSGSIPEHSRVYIPAAMRQYSALLNKYYRGVRLNSLDNLPSLTHRMVMSDSNPYN